jgi:general secretion pathway protein G
MTQNMKRQNGFTLIELLLVLVIITVLASIVVPRFTGQAEKAKITKAKADISNIETSLKMFETENGRFPTSDEGLAALVQAPSNLPNWHAYLDKGVPVDPWGNQYVYKFPGSHGTDFDLYSLGPDGREGNDDIVNWQQ